MDDSCPNYDDFALYPIAAGGYNAFCPPIACSGICGGTALIDDCGTCVCQGDDPDEAEGCVNEEYNKNLLEQLQPGSNNPLLYKGFKLEIQYDPKNEFSFGLQISIIKFFVTLSFLKNGHTAIPPKFSLGVSR